MILMKIEKPETKLAIADFFEAIRATDSAKEKFFELWAKSKNQKEVLCNTRFFDNVIPIREKYEFLMFQKMQSAIQKELNAPFRCSEWKL